MSRVTFLSAGSNTTVSSSPGVLYGIHVSGANGGTVLVADNDDLGATPNFNAVNQTGLIASIGPLANAGVHAVPFHGARFENGLTVAATSNAKVTVLHSE